jgi:hypothetical protein
MGATVRREKDREILLVVRESWGEIGLGPGRSWQSQTAVTV